MRIYGIDFTSAPRKAKPIVCCLGTLEGHRLEIDSIESWTSFEPFEAFLKSSGPWFAGLDSPLGQPAKLIQDFGWPKRWSDYVSRVSDLSRSEFVSKLEAYSKSQPAGQKHLFRETDRSASACSPMMIYGVPVAKMFYEAAPRLLRSSVSILPCRPTTDDRVVVETYPALVARELIGRTSYKAGARSADTTAKQSARRELSRTLRKSTKQNLGFELSVSATLAKSCEADHSGDRIDAILCCVKAAWAFENLDTVMPADVDANEGWIVHS